MRITVSGNKRYLIQEDGKPFFYMGDTAWELFHRLNREEAERYLRDRSAKGFTVIQAVALAELDGLHTPNPYGHTPLIHDDPMRPNEEYWKHVDFVVDLANRLGLYIGMLPTWGDKWNLKWGVGPVIFTPQNAQQYGAWIARRYKQRNIIWILGGDRCPENEEHFAIIRAMAQGIRSEVGRNQLITYHPWGGRSSAEFFHHDEWLDFNMIQSGHAFNRDNWRRVASDYARTPTKPCMDGEPGYEDMPSEFEPKNGYMQAYDVRKFAYWAVFAGAHGHTYGCNNIWQMWTPDREPVIHARQPWYESLKLPGSTQVPLIRNLMLSRPFLTRIPDQSVLACEAGEGGEHISATRASDGSYVMVYVPRVKPVQVHMDKVAGRQAVAWWFDPRTGKATRIGTFATKGIQQFVPPPASDGSDWVLVLDEQGRKFPAPGKRG